MHLHRHQAIAISILTCCCTYRCTTSIPKSVDAMSYTLPKDLRHFVCAVPTSPSLQQGSQHRPISGAAARIATSLGHWICSTLISPTKKCAYRKNPFNTTLLRDLSIQTLHPSSMRLEYSCLSAAATQKKLALHINAAVPDFQACNAIDNSARH